MVFLRLTNIYIFEKNSPCIIAMYKIIVIITTIMLFIINITIVTTKTSNNSSDYNSFILCDYSQKYQKFFYK